MLAWLEHDDPFPPVERALKNPNGLLAAGADLSVERLLEAYRRGVFPWYSKGQPPLWWSPDPRMVLFCAELKVPRSLAKSIRNKGYEVRVDSAFPEVLKGCAEPRSNEPGTWLGPDMRVAYARLHQDGYAHSFETWRDGELVGGLYGVALVALVQHLKQKGFPLIDCQMHTPLLESLGAREIPRREFLRALAGLVNYPEPPSKWMKRTPESA